MIVGFILWLGLTVIAAGLSVWLGGWWVVQDRDWIMSSTLARLGFLVATAIVAWCYLNITMAVVDAADEM